MRFAYADPPYVGCGHRYKEKTEIDQRALVEQLVAEFPDGWALSLSSPSLQEILSYCPSDVRVMAWGKPWCSWKPSGTVAYAWEPVIVSGGRRRAPGRHYGVKDWLYEPVSTNLYFNDGEKAIGAKPVNFCRWILEVLNYQNGDEIVDLFPGTGIMSACAAQIRLV